jgi:hypothetical protein
VRRKVLNGAARESIDHRGQLAAFPHVVECPAPGGALRERLPISTRINSPRDNDAGIMAPVSG